MTTLKLAKTLLAKLPDKFTYLEGSLDLTDSSIVELPNDMTVKGDLIVGNAPILSLPQGLIVLGNLNLINSSINIIPNDAIIEGQIITKNKIYYEPISYPSYTITDRAIIMESNTPFPYFDKLTIGERSDHYDRWVDFVDKYFLYNGDFIYVFQNKWFIYRKKSVNEQDIINEIERRKRDERVGDKYKNMSLDTLLNLKDFFILYQELTDTCELALIRVQKVFEELQISIEDKYPLSRWIEGSKMANYKYNWLFTEYFEEDTNESINSSY